MGSLTLSVIDIFAFPSSFEYKIIPSLDLYPFKNLSNNSISS